MPKISVVMPYYNADLSRLRLAIDSVLGQSFSDFELIVVIDGSPKPYEDLRTEVERRDKRVRFLIQENRGVSAARNAGIDAAAGEYLSFVDSDDYVEENFLSRLQEALQSGDVAICGVVDQEHPTLAGTVGRRDLLSQPDTYCKEQYMNFSVNKLYRKAIIDQHHIRFDEAVKQGEDALFLADYYEHCAAFAIIEDGLYHYVCDPNSAMHHYYPSFWDWEARVIERQWAQFTSYPLASHQEDFLYFWLFLKLRRVFMLYLAEDRANGKRLIEQVVKSAPYQRLIAADLRGRDFFTKKSRAAILLWRTLDAWGVRLWYSTRKPPGAGTLERRTAGG